jgi:hypothetical protein
MHTAPHDGDRAVADAYLNAVYQGDAAVLATLFDPAAQVYGEINGQPYFKSAAVYVEGVAARPSPLQLGEPYAMRVLAIDGVGEIANVKLHSPMLGFNYQLYLTLRRIDGEWLIVNKTFAHLPPASA